MEDKNQTGNNNGKDGKDGRDISHETSRKTSSIEEDDDINVDIQSQVLRSRQLKKKIIIMIVNLNQIYLEDHTKINIEIKKLKIDKENVSININMSNNLMIYLSKVEDVEIVMMNDDDLFKDHNKNLHG